MFDGSDIYVPRVSKVWLRDGSDKQHADFSISKVKSSQSHSFLDPIE
jgi:hypothetical protein